MPLIHCEVYLCVASQLTEFQLFFYTSYPRSTQQNSSFLACYCGGKGARPQKGQSLMTAKCRALHRAARISESTGCTDSALQ